MKVLVVDDDHFNRLLLHNRLSKLKYTVETAADGQEALQRLSQPDAPKLIILDWMMPGLSGLDVCRQHRDTEEKIHTYIIILTAKSSKEDIVTALEAGADDYLVKPFDMNELHARIRVGERNLILQAELQKRIQDMEVLLRRNNLLGEIFQKHAASTPNPASIIPTNTRQKVPSTSNLSAKLSKLKPIKKAEALFIKILQQLGGSSIKTIAPDVVTKTAPAYFTVWSALILRSKEIWLDFLLEIDLNSAKKLFTTMTGTPPQSESDIQDSLGELLNMFIKLLARALENHELVEIIAPFIPKAVLTQNFPPFLQPETGFAHYGFYLPGMIMRLTLFENPAPVQHKPIKELSPADIIAQNIPSPKNRRITLLRESTVLNERYIQTLIGNIKPGKNTVSIPIIEASLLSKGIYSD